MPFIFSVSRHIDYDLAQRLKDQKVDLLVLEGMGRAIHTNFDTNFNCESLKVAVIKNRWLAARLGGDMYSVVFKYEQTGKTTWIWIEMALNTGNCLLMFCWFYKLWFLPITVIPLFRGHLLCNWSWIIGFPVVIQSHKYYVMLLIFQMYASYLNWYGISKRLLGPCVCVYLNWYGISKRLLGPCVCVWVWECVSVRSLPICHIPRWSVINNTKQHYKRSRGWFLWMLWNLWYQLRHM